MKRINKSLHIPNSMKYSTSITDADKLLKRDLLKDMANVLHEDKWYKIRLTKNSFNDYKTDSLVNELNIDFEEMSISNVSIYKAENNFEPNVKFFSRVKRAFRYIFKNK